MCVYTIYICMLIIYIICTYIESLQSDYIKLLSRSSADFPVGHWPGLGPDLQCHMLGLRLRAGSRRDRKDSRSLGHPKAPRNLAVCDKDKQSWG